MVAEPENFTQFNFFAMADKDRIMFNMTCTIKVEKFNHSVITKKYLERSSNIGMDTVKTKKLPEIHN